jgi:hypothetical protein
VLLLFDFHHYTAAAREVILVHYIKRKEKHFLEITLCHHGRCVRMIDYYNSIRETIFQNDI